MSELDINIDIVFREYNVYSNVNPNKIVNLSKIKNLPLISQQDVSVRKLIASSNVSTIYLIRRWSSEYVSFEDKRKIVKIVRFLVMTRLLILTM